MTHPAGWYGDPQDPSQQRYWDGAFWTDFRRPAPMAPPPGQGYGYHPMVPSTPDGVPLSGWWKRVLATIVDAIILTVVSLPLIGYFMYNALQVMIADIERQMDDARAGGGQIVSTLSWEVYKWLLPATAIGLVVGFAYEYFFLTRRGATPGKMAVGISVRLRDVAGPPPGEAVVKRWGLDTGLSLLGAIPLVGSLFNLAALLSYLWPLWDSKKQAWHDKVAGTNVVVGPQPVRRS